MTDLDQLFSPLIDESASRRAPVEEIETRARAYRRRERRRHRAQGFVAGAAAIALVVGAVAFVRTGGDASTPPAQSTPTSTTIVARVTAGWQTYDYGLARLSIPPGWTASSGCPQTHTLLMADPNTPLGCGAGHGGPTISIAPFVAGPGPYTPNATVNGIPYERIIPRCLTATCEPFARVKALGVTISTSGIDLDSILRTLTYSTYALVLQHPFAAAPQSWKTVTLDGVTARVPSSWRVDKASPDLCKPVAHTAYVGVIRNYRSDCLQSAISGGTDWVDLEVLPVAYSQGVTTSTTLSRVTGRLDLRRQPSFGPLTPEISYFAAGEGETVAITIGLGADPAIARGILGSLRPAR
jgi:hypothetical protein